MRVIDIFKQEIFSASIVLLLFSCDLEKIPDVIEPQIIDFSPIAGRSGDVITIQGANFGEDITKIQVKINDLKAQITTPPSDGNLEVLVPRGAGSGDIVITVGQYEASKEGFIYMLSGDVSTFAGSGEEGFQDGNAETARFFFPYGLADDNQDNIYVGDFDNHRIRKITPEGVVTTIAGTGSLGLTNGEGNQAAFMYPAGLDRDKNGDLFVADFGNHIIRKIALGGSNIVSSVAGNINSGYHDAFGGLARFNGPIGIAVDKENNILVADRDNNVIRIISPAGSVTTYAGDGLPGDLEGNRLSMARFRGPEDITVDISGNIYLTDSYNHKIKLITPEGSVTTVAGNGTSGNINGTGTIAQFNAPKGIDSDNNGNLYVADRFNNKVRIVTTEGFTYDLAGDGTFGYKDGPGLQAKISEPFGLVLDSKGNVYVACFRNNNIRKIVVF